MTVELGKGLGVGGVNPFEQTQETAKPEVQPQVAKETNPFRNGLFGGLNNMAKAATGGGESPGLRFGAQLPGLGSNNPFAKSAAAAASLFGKMSPVGAAVSTVANAALNHLGPTSTLGQMGSIAQQAAMQGTNQLMTNAGNGLDLTQMQDTADQTMKLRNAAARISQQIEFNDTMNDMNNKTWKTIQEMFK